MSWIISSVDISFMRLSKYEKWYYHSDVITEVQGKMVLTEGDFYNHKHCFVDKTLTFFDTVEGSFAIAIFSDDSILCASDCVCTRNIYYYQTGNFYCVSSSLQWLVNALYDRAYVALDSAYLYTYPIYGDKHYRTPYRGVCKLPAGYCIRMADSISIFPYLNFDLESEFAKRNIENRDTAEYAVEILKTHCGEITEKYKNKTILTEISGGVDSALLTGLLYEEGRKKSIELNGYSYTYQNQIVGNELLFMKDVAKKNKIANHMITNLGIDSYRLSEQHETAFPSISILNAGLLHKTRDAVSSADAIVSGQGGDICIGDEYNAFAAGRENVFVSAYCDSMYCEKFILKTLMDKYIFPICFGNIATYQRINSTHCYPVWITNKMQFVANHTINGAFRRICQNTKSYGMRMVLFDYLDYNGLVSDDIIRYICFFPYFSRDMLVLGRVFNNGYAESGIYRYNIKRAARKYLPLSVYLRKGKSRMDAVCQQAFIRNEQIYRDIVNESVLLKKMSINKEQVWSEMQRIIDGKNSDVNYSLRLLSLLIWHEEIRDKYPTERL